MEISNITFSDEFKEKTMRKLSPQRKGQLRWERLVQADKEGTLQKATRRIDVGKLAGINEYKSAYGWVANLVFKGALTETIAGFKNGKAIYEYHLGKPLVYENGKKKLARLAKTYTTAPQSVVERASTEVSLASNSDGATTIRVTINGAQVEVEHATVDYVIAIIKELYK